MTSVIETVAIAVFAGTLNRRKEIEEDLEEIKQLTEDLDQMANTEKNRVYKKVLAVEKTILERQFIRNERNMHLSLAVMIGSIVGIAGAILASPVFITSSVAALTICASLLAFKLALEWTEKSDRKVFEPAQKQLALLKV